MALKISDQLRSKIIDSGLVGGLGTSALVTVYDGTQPSTSGGTSGTCNLIVSISGVAWTSSSNGTAAILASKTGTAATDGTATWARVATGTSSTAYMFDGNCGTTAAYDFTLDSNVIAKNNVVTLTAVTLVQPAA
jgi:hypothetical protein